jgi:23S rRNA pseudouridine1911/1915/1917 synthase
MGSPPIELTVAASEDDLRLDKFVRQKIPGLSGGSVRRLLERKLVLVEGKSRPKGFRVAPGQQVLVAVATRDERPTPQPELDLHVIAEGPDLLVLNKAAGLPCHPLVPGETDTVANALAARFPECVEASAQARECGLVHRLDWSTSGLLLAARNPNTYGRLRGMFSSGQVLKQYLALVQGIVEEPGSVNSFLRTMPGDRSRMQVVGMNVLNKGGREAETDYAPVERLEQRGLTLVRATCRTGRRHQVRAHLAHAGYPLVGDDKYGGPEVEGLEGAYLHAARIELLPSHTIYEAPLPRVRLEVLRRLGGARPVAVDSGSGSR